MGPLTIVSCTVLQVVIAIVLSSTGMFEQHADALIAALFAWSLPMIIVGFRIGAGPLKPAHFYDIFKGCQICLILAGSALVRLWTGTPTTTRGWVLTALLIPLTLAIVGITRRALFSCEELESFDQKRKRGATSREASPARRA